MNQFNNCHRSNQIHSNQKHKENITCKFWATSYCKYGDQCRYNHNFTQDGAPKAMFDVLMKMNAILLTMAQLIQDKYQQIEYLLQNKMQSNHSTIMNKMECNAKQNQLSSESLSNLIKAQIKHKNDNDKYLLERINEMFQNHSKTKQATKTKTHEVSKIDDEANNTELQNIMNQLTSQAHEQKAQLQKQLSKMKQLKKENQIQCQQAAELYQTEKEAQKRNAHPLHGLIKELDRALTPVPNKTKKNVQTARKKEKQRKRRKKKGKSPKKSPRVETIAKTSHKTTIPSSHTLSYPDDARKRCDESSNKALIQMKPLTTAELYQMDKLIKIIEEFGNECWIDKEIREKTMALLPLINKFKTY